MWDTEWVESYPNWNGCSGRQKGPRVPINCEGCPCLWCVNMRGALRVRGAVFIHDKFWFSVDLASYTQTTTVSVTGVTVCLMTSFFFFWLTVTVLEPSLSVIVVIVVFVLVCRVTTLSWCRRLHLRVAFCWAWAAVAWRPHHRLCNTHPALVA